MEPLAYVYKSVLSEVLNDISEGIVRSTVEFLDSSTVGLSERAGHDSRSSGYPQEHVFLTLPSNRYQGIE